MVSIGTRLFAPSFCCLRQVTVSGMEGWVRCMSFDSSGDVGDMGAMYAADESGGITKIVPEALWDDSIQR